MSNFQLARTARTPAVRPVVALADTLIALSTEAFDRHRSGKFASAIEYYQRILAVTPGLPIIRHYLGHALAQTGQAEAAIAEYRRAVELKPDYVEALCDWGSELSNLDRLDEAEAKFRDAIAANPRLANAHYNLSIVLKDLGRLKEACHAARQAIRLAPRNTKFYSHLVAMKPLSGKSVYVKSLELMRRENTDGKTATGRSPQRSGLTRAPAGLSAEDRVHLHFALAQTYEHAGDVPAAFAEMAAGNQLQRSHTAYDEADRLGRMDSARRLFTDAFLRSRIDAGVPSRLPIFVIGMPRSGTSLIEQILASHPEIYGAGELKLFERSIGTVASTRPEVRLFPEAASQLSAEQFRALGTAYVEQLSARAPGTSRIVDKMPGNFHFAGLIHLALPNATIIHAVRDPRDTCLSSFATHFIDQPHSYDLGELGRYFRHYQDLMTHWRRVLPPGRMLEVRYEAVVEDLEQEARRMIAHCGLTWDPRCLEFHRTDRPVRTASAAQVRRPIYDSSVGRWRKFQRFLGPLLRELNCTHVLHPTAADKRAGVTYEKSKE